MPPRFHSEQSAYTEYTDARREESTMLILPALKKCLQKELVKASEGSGIRLSRNRPPQLVKNRLCFLRRAALTSRYHI